MYLDSAILVKLVVREPDSRFYSQLADGRRDVWSSELALTECWSALLRKEEEGAIDAHSRLQAWRILRAYWEAGTPALQPVTRAILQSANDLMQRCRGKAALKTLDAIHLASCTLHQAFPLVTNDRVLRKAAAALDVPLGAMP